MICLPESYKQTRLQRALERATKPFYQTFVEYCGRGGDGWCWRHEELAQSIFTSMLLSHAYELADAAESHQVFVDLAQQESEYLIPDIALPSRETRFLHSLVLRHYALVQSVMDPQMLPCFTANPSVIGGIQASINGLRNYPRYVHRIFKNSVCRCFFHKRVAIAAAEEIRRRHRQRDKHLQYLFGVATDEFRPFFHNELMKLLDRTTCNLPAGSIYEKADVLHELIEERVNQLQSEDLLTQLEQLESDSDLIYFPKRANGRVENLRKKAWRETRRLRSFDEPVYKPSGDTATTLEFLEAEGRASYIQPMEIDEDFTPDQLNALDKELGKIGRKIFVYRYQHQEIIGRGEGKIIAEALEYAPATVSKYLKTIEAKASVIQKIMRI